MKFVIPCNRHMAQQLKPQIDPCNFQVVKSHLRSPKSEITHVVLVQDGHLLHEVAAFYVAPRTENIERVLLAMLKEGVVKYAVESMDTVNPSFRAYAVLIDSISDSAPCAVIYLPPFYMVKIKRPRRPRRESFEEQPWQEQR